nr:hypothetical protein Iba_chr14eCG10470 [Ipomoea batatas]
MGKSRKPMGANLPLSGAVYSGGHYNNSHQLDVFSKFILWLAVLHDNLSGGSDEKLGKSIPGSDVFGGQSPQLPELVVKPSTSRKRSVRHYGKTVQNEQLSIDNTTWTDPQVSVLFLKKPPPQSLYDKLTLERFTDRQLKLKTF